MIGDPDVTLFWLSVACRYSPVMAEKTDAAALRLTDRAAGQDDHDLVVEASAISAESRQIAFAIREDYLRLVAQRTSDPGGRWVGHPAGVRYSYGTVAPEIEAAYASAKRGFERQIDIERRLRHLE